MIRDAPAAAPGMPEEMPARISEAKRADSRPTPSALCGSCGKPFLKRRAWARFCSKECQQAFHGRRAGAPGRAEDRRRFLAVAAAAFDRLESGEAVYGAFSPATDRRDLRHEAEEELLDTIVYAYLAILRLRHVSVSGGLLSPLKPANLYLKGDRADDASGRQYAADCGDSGRAPSPGKDPSGRASD